MKKTLFILFTLILFSCSSDNDSESFDLIIGTWTELGQGIVSDDGTTQFSEYDGFCVTLGRFSFNEDGTFNIETFDGPDDGCFSTGILTGIWKNQGESYLIEVLTDSSSESETGQKANIRIEFPNENRMQWVFQSVSDGSDYRYEEDTRLE